MPCVAKWELRAENGHAVRGLTRIIPLIPELLTVAPNHWPLLLSIWEPVWSKLFPAREVGKVRFVAVFQHKERQDDFHENLAACIFNQSVKQLETSREKRNWERGVFQPPKITNHPTLLLPLYSTCRTIFGKRSYFTAKNKNTALIQLTFSIKGNFLTGVVPWNFTFEDTTRPINPGLRCPRCGGSNQQPETIETI